MTSLAVLEETISPPQFQTPLFCFLSSTLNPRVQPDIWVKLTELPSPFAHEEALLLCQHSVTEWVVWIPDFGEAIIDLL
jgi:hypothetical protein